MATSRSDRPAPDLPPESGRHETSGHLLYWERGGRVSDPAVVFLHHGLGSTRAWKAQAGEFQRHGWQTVAYDRWGYGRSSSRASLDLPTFTADVQDLASLMNHLGLGRAALVGHSDGGTTALYFAAQYPQRVSALVTVAAHIYLEPSMAPGMLAIRRIFDGDARFQEGMRRAHGAQAEAVFRNWYDGWVRPERLAWDMRPMLKDVHCPTLVVQGELDEYASPQHARDLAGAVAHGSLWLMAGVGHMAPQDAYEAFNQRVLEFLEPFRQGVSGSGMGSGVDVL